MDAAGTRFLSGASLQEVWVDVLFLLHLMVLDLILVIKESNWRVQHCDCEDIGALFLVRSIKFIAHRRSITANVPRINVKLVVIFGWVKH